MKKVMVFLIVAVALAVVFFNGYLAGYSSGYGKAQTEKPQEKVVYHSSEYMYTVYILRNCLTQLKELKGGEK